MSSNFSFNKVEKADLTIVKDLLDRNDLPSKDIGNDDVIMFMASNNSELIGIIGIEIYDNIGFLRSMVIDDKFRNKGFGRKICGKLLEYCRENNLIEVYLLSKDAADFFEHLGFIKINREDAPDVIKSTRQFNGLCPCSAFCLKIIL